jgi:Domain of unknown function (DUF4282)
MNQQCPKCGTTYGVTPAHVGRTFTCKNCSTSVAVTPAGLVLASAAPSPSPPPPPAAAGTFDFGGGGRGRGMSLDDDDDDDRDDDRRKPSRGRAVRSGSGGGFGDFLAFRKMVIPIIIQIIFWIAVILVTIGSLAFGVMNMGGRGQQQQTLAIVAFASIPLSILLIRVYCELIIVVFRINDTLTDIKNILARRRD